MYGGYGKLTASEGKRDDLVQILIRAADVVRDCPGCRLYVVNEDIVDTSCVWVYEIWDDKESHDASLRDEQVRSLIAQAMPLLSTPPEGAELKVIGGYGLEN